MEVVNTMHRLEKDLECVAEGAAASCSCNLDGILNKKVLHMTVVTVSVPFGSMT